MKTRSALGALALVLGITLTVATQVPPAAAQAGDDLQVAQRSRTRPAPNGAGAVGAGPMHGHGGWRQHMTHRFSLARLVLRHQQELALTPAQVQNLRQLGTDAQRDAIKRQADRRLAELELQTLMVPDPANPDKPRDLAKIETQVREIEKLRADGRMAGIRTMEQSRQVLTPEQREKLRTLLAERWPHRRPRGSQMPGMHGMGSDDSGHEPAAAEEHSGSAG